MTDTATAVPPHPCKWSQPVLDAIEEVGKRYDITGKVLDQFAGVDLARLRAVLPNADVTGVELEPEWAKASGAVEGDALRLPWHGPPIFDAMCTSPTFGNRCADSHEAKDDSMRITYRHKLGRMPSEGSSAVMQFAGPYRQFHFAAWNEALRVLVPRALILVNIANHVRGGIEQRVTEFHLNAWMQLGATVEEVVRIDTRKMGFGANRNVRIDGERLLVLRAPEKRGML